MWDTLGKEVVKDLEDPWHAFFIEELEIDVVEEVNDIKLRFRGQILTE